MARIRIRATAAVAAVQRHNPFVRVGHSDLGRRRLEGITARLHCALLLILSLVLAGCSMLPARGRVEEFRSATVPKVGYAAVAVIAGNNSTPTLQMSANVRGQFNEQGIKAIPASGRWEDEREALSDICLPTAVEPVEGVLIVTYNQLVLHECSSKQIAYRINGGGRLGISQMADRVIAYIRSNAAASSSSSPP